MRLGRLPHTPEAVSRAPRLAARMPPPAPPPRLDRSHINYRPQLLGNDLKPICTGVAQVNAALGFAACNGLTFETSEPPIDAAYSAVTGVPLDQIAASDGAILLDVMRYQSRVGIPIADQILLTGPFGVIEPQDRALLATACALIGPVVLGVDLTTAEQQPGVWDTGRPAREWGGHALVLWSFTGLADTDTVQLATWGTLQTATWRWLHAQLREAYAVSWPALMPASGRQWAALDREGLADDVAAWCGA